jgi:hypothetical protein
MRERMEWWELKKTPSQGEAVSCYARPDNVSFNPYNGANKNLTYPSILTMRTQVRAPNAQR